MAVYWAKRKTTDLHFPLWHGRERSLSRDLTAAVRGHSRRRPSERQRYAPSDETSEAHRRNAIRIWRAAERSCPNYEGTRVALPPARHRRSATGATDENHGCRRTRADSIVKGEWKCRSSPKTSWSRIHDTDIPLRANISGLPGGRPDRRWRSLFLLRCRQLEANRGRLRRNG